MTSTEESTGPMNRGQPTTVLRIGVAPAFRWIGIGITVLALLSFLLYLRRNLESLPALRLNWALIQTLGASLMVQSCALLGGAIAWIVLLRGSGGVTSAVRGLSIYLVAQFGKYIPGNVGHHIGRVALSQSDGIRTIPVLMAMSIEIIGSMLAALLVVIVSLTASQQPIQLLGQVVPAPRLLGAVGLLVAVGLAAGWWIIRFKPGPFRALLSSDDGRVPSLLPLMAALVLHTTAILMIGANVILLGSALYGHTAPYLRVVGVYALAWIVGYLTPGAPAGLGIREVILVAGLAPFYGPGAAAIALIHRLVVTGSDALVLGVGLFLRRGPLLRVAEERGSLL